MGRSKITTRISAQIRHARPNPHLRVLRRSFLHTDTRDYPRGIGGSVKPCDVSVEQTGARPRRAPRTPDNTCAEILNGTLARTLRPVDRRPPRPRCDPRYSLTARRFVDW